MRPDELTGVRQRAPAVLKIRVPDRPCMDHARPDWQRHTDIGRACGPGKPRRVRRSRCVRQGAFSRRRPPIMVHRSCSAKKRHGEQEAPKFLSAPLKPNRGFLIFLLPPQGGPGA